MADVLVFGADSLVGSHFVAYSGLSVAAAGRADPRLSGLVVDRFEPVDLVDRSALSRLVLDASEPTVINFAARTDVDGVEQERPPPGEEPRGPAWEVNALAPGVIARAAAETGKHLVQISTDFVFDGRDGPYDESALRSPLSSALSWYGWSKSEGERLVAERLPKAGIVRISLPFRSKFPGKLDFARGILKRFQDGSLTGLYTDQQITPTWIPDVTEVLRAMAARRVGGIVHVVSPRVTTPLEFGMELLRRAGHDASKVPTSTLASVRAPDRAPRPLRGGLRTQAATALGAPLTSWDEAIRRFIAEQGGRQ